jgi:hypothetical protein
MTDKWHTHTHTHTHTFKPEYEQEDVTVSWNQGIHTERKVTANRPDIIIKNKKEKTCVLIGVAIPVDRNIMQKEAEKTKIKDFMYSDTVNLEHEMYIVLVIIWAYI